MTFLIKLNFTRRNQRFENRNDMCSDQSRSTVVKHNIEGKVMTTFDVAMLLELNLNCP